MTIVFANAQQLIVSYLREKLDGSADPMFSNLVVGVTVPRDRRDGSPPLLVVRRSGGPAQPPILDLPRLDLMCWHEAEFKAQAVASRARALLLYDLPGRVLDGHTVYRVREFSGPSPYQDPAGSSTPIVMFTVEVAIRVVAGTDEPEEPDA